MIKVEDPTVKELRELREWNERRHEEDRLLNNFIDDISETYFKHWRYVEDHIRSHNSRCPYYTIDTIREKLRDRLRGDNE